MKTTPIPELRNLAPGFVIQRCMLCHELVFADEACRTYHERWRVRRGWRSSGEPRGCWPRDMSIARIRRARLLWMVLRELERTNMARVGFRAIGKYQDLKLDELDRDADKLADRVDGIVAKGKNAIASHHKG